MKDHTENERSPITVSRSMSGTRITLSMVSCSYSFVIYELIRAFFFLLFSKKGRRSVSFRIKGGCLSAQCLCNEYLPVWQYVVVSLMPAVLLGGIPLFYALFSGRYLLLPIAVLFLLMGVNDYKIVWLLRYFEADHFVKNNPALPGC